MAHAHGVVCYPVSSASSVVPIMDQRYLDSLLEGDGTYCALVQQLANTSMQDAVMEEIRAEEAAGSCAESISILTDPHNCWRKNARFSDVVSLGQRTHKVLCVKTVMMTPAQRGMRWLLSSVSTNIFKTRVFPSSVTVMATMPLSQNIREKSNRTPRMPRTHGMPEKVSLVMPRRAVVAQPTKGESVAQATYRQGNICEDGNLLLYEKLWWRCRQSQAYHWQHSVSLQREPQPV